MNFIEDKAVSLAKSLGIKDMATLSSIEIAMRDVWSAAVEHFYKSAVVYNNDMDEAYLRYSFEILLQSAEDVYGVTAEKILSPQRHHEITMARHCVSYHMQVTAGATTTFTGKLMNRDHSTAINSKRTWSDLIDSNRKTRELNDRFYRNYSHRMVIGRHGAMSALKEIG